MLREEVEQYTNLTGEDGWHVPIMKVGAYLDGYNKGLEVLDKIRKEIVGWQTDIHDNEDDANKFDFVFERILEIIDEYNAESEDKK